MHLYRKGFALLGSLMILTSCALANQYSSVGSSVVVNGVSVFRLASTVGGTSPVQRAQQMVERLTSMTTWGQVDVKEQGGDRVLLVSGQELLTITPQEAADHGARVADLATAWARKLKQAMDLPPLKVSDNFVRLATGGSQTIKVTGSQSAGATAQIDSPTVAQVKRVTEGFQICAKTIGHATVTVTSGRSMENIDVEVKPYAANFPQTLTAFVTGAPATAKLVDGAIEGALNTQLSLIPTAHFTFKKVATTDLPTGSSATYSVRAWAAGPEAYPSSGLVNVVVKNAAIPLQTDDDLWYSNDPESVHDPRSLFSANLKTGASARLLYHHVNGSMQDIFLRAEIVNANDQPARVEVIPGDSRPDKDPVRAGANAADQFVQNWIYGSGEVLTIPPQSAMPLSIHRLAPGETGSGLCSVRLLDGPASVQVRTDAFPPLNVDPKWDDALFSSTPWREVGSHAINDYDRAPFETSPHIYPQPYTEESVDYQIGGRYGFLRIGQKPIARADADGSLDGNFGVIYHIKANLKNPSSEPQDVEIVFEASAGYTAGIFVIDGNCVRTKELPPKGKIRLAKIHLLPGASRVVDITTLPVSGSSYPATMIVRPVLATAPEAHATNRL